MKEPVNDVELSLWRLKDLLFSEVLRYNRDIIRKEHEISGIKGIAHPKNSTFAIIY